MKGEFIYWRWKGGGSWSKSYVQDIVETFDGQLLELADSTWWTNHPNRVLVTEIDILRNEKIKP